MDIRLRFPLKRRFRLEDHWPIKTGGAKLTFEIAEGEATAIVVLYRDQSTDMAPAVERLESGPAKAQIAIRGEIEGRGRRLVQRFIDFVNLYFSLDVDLGAMEAEYIPISEDERQRIGMYAFSSKRERPITSLPFDMLAQAVFAGETQEDPSFVSRMFHLAREALISEQYIDSFRYAFLLIEAVYGAGKFKTPQLIAALLTSDFRAMVEETLVEHAARRSHDLSETALTAAYPTPETLVDYLVERRGFYFHGNLARRESWHPDRQQDAKPLAELSMELGSKVAHAFAGAMFGDAIGSRYFANAEAFGAIMSIDVEFQHMGRDGRRQIGHFRINTPGRLATSTLAIRVHRQFLEWAEVELGEERLISAVAKVAGTNEELFRSEYLPAASAPLPPDGGLAAGDPSL